MLFRQIITVFPPNHTNSKTLTSKTIKTVCAHNNQHVSNGQRTFSLSTYFQASDIICFPHYLLGTDRKVDIQAIIFVNIFLYSENTG